MDNTRPKSLITGGAGFIGSHVAANCLALGHDVTVLDDLSGGFERNVPAGSQFIHGSVTDGVLLRSLFAERRFDYVYHLAAYAAEGLSHYIRTFNYTNNLIGSVNLINESIRNEVRCFVFTSSIAVYGRNQLPMKEELVPHPEDPYGISKYAVELDLSAARELFGLPFIVFRPHNVYGPRQNVGDPYRNVLGIFMNQILRGEPLTIFGDGTQTRAFTHIDDVAPHIARSVYIEEAHGHVFNIGSDTPCSVNNLAELVCQALGVSPTLRYLPSRNEVDHAWASHEKASRLLGTRPRKSLKEGIGEMAEWVRKSGVQLPRPFANIEVNKNLPSSWAQLALV